MAFEVLNNTSADLLDYRSTILSWIPDLLAILGARDDFHPTGEIISLIITCGGAVGGIWGRTGNSGMDKRLCHALGNTGNPIGGTRGDT